MIVAEKIKRDISLLSVNDKLRLIEEIWDQVSEKNNSIPLPEWQKKELDRRYEEYESEKVELHEVQAVHDQLRDLYK
ncbi:MAG: addiction module protein [Kiritimatiellae bacterium]|jgi:putative addiction module component (TIGR02574 family)|nr:addiction module protein [Kiritimatiellia bacterium]